MNKTTALPERIAATAAADALSHAEAIRAALSSRLSMLNAHIENARSSHAAAIETAAHSLAGGTDALSVLPLDLSKQETETTVLTSALAIAGEKIVVLRAKAEDANRKAERAETADKNAKAISAIAARGLRIVTNGTQIATARLEADAAFACTTIADAEALADLVMGTGAWPWGRAKALSALHTLAKGAANAA